MIQCFKPELGWPAEFRVDMLNALIFGAGGYKLAGAKKTFVVQPRWHARNRWLPGKLQALKWTMWN